MKTLKLRIKDKHCKVLDQLAVEANFVWNYVNDLCFKHLKRKGQFLSAYDVAKYTKGASKECNLHSQTVQAITEELITCRKQCKKAKLKWRVSNKKSAKRSLGWVPFKHSAVRCGDGWVTYRGNKFHFWDSYGVHKYNIKCGSFVEDSRGRWYVCLVVDDISTMEFKGTSIIGIDLGLKSLITCSDGTKIDAPRIYRKYEEKLGISQRAKKKNRTRAIHAKIKNVRNNMLHQLSHKLVKENAAIVIGDVNARALARTKMSKSVQDAGWSMFRTMLRYKCENAGVWFGEVNEAYTTQTCSCCGVISHNSPKGRAGLGIREWKCDSCGAIHDRDINAARNILALGHGRLAGGIPIFRSGRMSSRFADYW